MRKKSSRLLSVILLIGLLTGSPIQAEIPNTITYQGSLKQADGTPLNDTVSMGFTLYDSLTSETELWSDTMSVSVNHGIYSVVLDVSASGLAFDQPYFLEVSVAGTPLSPRQALTSAPYALGVPGIHVKDGKVGIGTADPTQALTVAGNALINNNLVFGGYLLGGADRSMAIYPNSNAVNSRNFIEFWGDAPTRGGELNLGGRYIDLYYGSGTDSYGEIGLPLTEDGKVGIGKAGAAFTLDISGNQRVSSDTHTNQGTGTMLLNGNVLTLAAAGGTALRYPYIQWLRNGGRGAYLGWGAHGHYFQLQLENENAFYIGGGNVGIGVTDPQYKLDVSGYIRSTNVTISSDRRWKTEIATLDDSLERVSRLRGVSFQWKDPVKGEGPQIGLIAQEVEEIFPELVSTDSEGYKSVSYDKLVAPLIEAVKTLKAENEELQRRLDALEATMNLKK